MSDVFMFLETEYKINFLNNKTIYNSVLDFLNEPNNNLKYNYAIEQLFIMKNNIDKDVNNIQRSQIRILCTMPDGQVWCDTAKGTKNTYENFKSKTINENHNTRIAIFEALQNSIGKEIKFSASTGFKEEYYANSIVDSPFIPLGVLRLSVN
jgi:hypothetical protein